MVRSKPTLDQAAIDAMKRWRYEPALVGGEAVAVTLIAPVDFFAGELRR